MATTPAIDMTTETIVGISTNAGNGQTLMESAYHPLVAATGTDTAVAWVDAKGWISLCVYVDITTSGTLNIVGSNAKANPGTSDNGFAIATAITADGFATVTQEKLTRWVKVYPSASGGAMTVDLRVLKIAMNAV
ncbi:MAG: hypothetical protein ACHQ6U_12170 [Thermodesulfobacteriota bacterium]